MGKIHAMRDFVDVASRGLDSGAAMRSAMTMQWNIAGKCERPAFRALTARQAPAGMKPWQEAFKVANDRRELELTVNCGKCPPCLRARAARWRHRATAETERSEGRTWFVTLTLAPEAHFQMMLRASVRLEAQGVDFESLSSAEQFAERHRETSRELTLWLKRVRKASAIALRYCLVAEAHKSGLPHYHALIHEVDSKPLRSSIMREQWKLGFSKCKLVAEGEQAKTAAYVAKYLSKSAMARIRASIGYGTIQQSPPIVIDNLKGKREDDVIPPLTPQCTTRQGDDGPPRLHMGTVQ